MSKSNNEAAFPLPHAIVDANDPHFKLGQPGMMLRDYLAAKAMAALLGDERIGMWIKETDGRFAGDNFHHVVAMNAYEFADAMIAERNK